jgi:ferric-dicitrate binding protein FerR (iron transport regulator)
MTEKFQELLKKMRAAFDSADKHPSWNTEKEDAVWGRIKEQTTGRKQTTRPLTLLRWTAAAAILIIIAAIYLIYSGRHNTAPAVAKSTIPISPGANRAYLVLATGQRVVLDDAKKGSVTTQGGTNVVKLDSGVLAYHPTTSAGATLYNTVVTPRGGQYQLILPDGTKVWLNASTSLRFPTAFSAGRREVELTGEAYFEVRHLPGQPFTVRTGHHTIEDIGTAFNINAYDDEPVAKVTLTEGEARVNGQRSLTLHPGQQVRWQADDPETLAKDVDTEDVLAWKNGQISFMNPDFSCVMRQISRWYDVDIRYTGAVPKARFFGIVSRGVYLSTLLEFFEHNNIHIRMDGRTLIVAPQ